MAYIKTNKTRGASRQFRTDKITTLNLEKGHGILSPEGYRAMLRGRSEEGSLRRAR